MFINLDYIFIYIVNKTYISSFYNLFVMFNTKEMLQVLCKLRPNRCRQVSELGRNVFGIYFDGNFQIIKINEHTNPSLNGVEQAMLVRSMYQTILGSGVYSIKSETVKKHRLLHQVWIDHEDIEATGFAEEVDLCDALLRAFIQVLEVEDILYQQEVESNPLFSDDTPITSIPQQNFIDAEFNPNTTPHSVLTVGDRWHVEDARYTPEYASEVA